MTRATSLFVIAAIAGVALVGCDRRIGSNTAYNNSGASATAVANAPSTDPNTPPRPNAAPNGGPAEVTAPPAPAK